MRVSWNRAVSHSSSHEYLLSRCVRTSVLLLEVLMRLGDVYCDGHDAAVWR